MIYRHVMRLFNVLDVPPILEARSYLSGTLFQLIWNIVPTNMEQEFQLRCTSPINAKNDNTPLDCELLLNPKCKLIRVLTRWDKHTRISL